ncbi:MAG: RND family transporter, partial [Bacteroidetes bacterium]
MKFWFIKYRLSLLIALLGITIGSLTLFPRLEIDPDLDNYVPVEMDNRVNMNHMDSIFGGSEMILVMLKDEDVVKRSTLKRLKNLSEELGNLEGIDRSVSPFDAQTISTEDGFIIMEPFMENIPGDQAGYNELKSEILGNRMASRFFSTDDFELVSLMLMKDSDYSDDLLITAIDSVLLEHPGTEEVLLGGLPYVRYSITGNIKKDLKVLLPVALLLMIFMLFASFREWKGVFMPFSVVIMSMILSFGVMALLGWNISLITVLMPIMLIAIANDYGIHMIARYQELAQSENPPSMLEICRQIYTDLKRPIIIAGLTTIGGILGLLTHTMIPAAQIGVLTAIGIGFSLILSIWFLPAMLSYFQPVGKVRVKKIRRVMSADKWLRKISHMVTNHPKQVIITSVLVGVLGITGIFFIKVDTNIEGYFLGNSKVSRSIKLINEKLGGSQFISILFSGEVLSPEILQRMEYYEKVLSEDPAVGTVSSPVTLVKELSKGFYNVDEEGYNQIPST